MSRVEFPITCDGCGRGMTERQAAFVHGNPCDYLGPPTCGSQGAPSRVERHWCSFECLEAWRDRDLASVEVTLTVRV